MGLNITAYSKLTVSSADLKKDKLSEILPRSSYSDVFEFRAGSFSRYNQWRNSLAAFQGISKEDILKRSEQDNVLFKELIDFDYTPEIIAGEAATRLYKDFVSNRDKYKEYLESHSYTSDIVEIFIDKYNDWTYAFKLAADSGAVKF